MYGMALSSLGDGGVHNGGGGGSFGIVGFTMGLILPYLERLCVGPHCLLRVRIIYYACCLPYARAPFRPRLPCDLLGVRILYYGSLILI